MQISSVIPELWSDIHKKRLFPYIRVSTGNSVSARSLPETLLFFFGKQRVLETSPADSFQQKNSSRNFSVWWNHWILSHNIRMTIKLNCQYDKWYIFGKLLCSTFGTCKKKLQICKNWICFCKIQLYSKKCKKFRSFLIQSQHLKCHFKFANMFENF